MSRTDPGPVMVLTDRRQIGDRRRGLVDVVRAALAGGATAVLLRDKDLGRDERARLAAELRTATTEAGAALVVAGDVALARAAGADGVHLATADPWPDCGTDGTREQAGAGHRLRVGRSCHRVHDLVEAAGHAADWATYSPVFATASKPGYGPALGLAGLAAGCRAAPGLPILALGGIGRGRARACLDAGASGVALMGAVMRSDDPGAVVRAVIDELRGAKA